jgi:hypothetical protein
VPAFAECAALVDSITHKQQVLRSNEKQRPRYLQEQETIEKANVLLRKLGYRVPDQQDTGEVAEE